MLIPYVYSLDHWSLSYAQMKHIYDLMIEENTFKTVFCSGNIRTFEDFYGFMQNPGNVVISNWIDEKIGVLAWLNNFTASSAFAHFNCFKTIWGKPNEYMHEIIDFWFNMQKDGKYLLETIIGMTPEPNRLALRKIKQLGFQTIGTIPNYTINAYTHEKIGMVVSHLQRR